jgi:hypothetical protein
MVITQENVDEFLAKVHQAGKKETSDLAGDILAKMNTKITESIEKTVNGKINNLTKMMNEQNGVISEHFNKVDAHMVKDDEWKEEYTPYIKGLASITDGGKIMVYIGVTLAAVGGAILAIRRWFL